MQTKYATVATHRSPLPRRAFLSSAHFAAVAQNALKRCRLNLQDNSNAPLPFMIFVDKNISLGYNMTETKTEYVSVAQLDRATAS